MAQKLPKITQNSPKITQNCPNWQKITQNCPNRPKNDPKLPKKCQEKLAPTGRHVFATLLFHRNLLMSRSDYASTG